jgi:hypothetical protein
MIRNAATVTGIVACLVARVTFAQIQPTDTQLRAAFCMGALDRGIVLFKPPPPIYLTPDGRGYTPPETAKQMRDYTNATLQDFGEKRERLRRFLVPYFAGADQLLPLSVAMAEGGRLYQDCNSAIAQGADANAEACRRVRPCFKLDWLPY